MVFLGLYYAEKRRKSDDDQILRFFFLCIPASAADTAAVNPKGIKTLLVNGLITFFIKGNTIFNNGPRSLSRNHPDCTILDNWVFDNLKSVDGWFVSKSLMKIFNLSIS